MQYKSSMHITHGHGMQSTVYLVGNLASIISHLVLAEFKFGDLNTQHHRCAI